MSSLFRKFFFKKWRATLVIALLVVILYSYYQLPINKRPEASSGDTVRDVSSSRNNASPSGLVADAETTQRYVRPAGDVDSIRRGPLLRKYVHLDLKGGPLKLDFLMKFLEYLAELGTDGIVIEYEDCFPYSSDLATVRRLNAYTPKQIRLLQRQCEMLHMKVIPLVQTYGHLEFVLKTEKFRHLREAYDQPEVITPCKNASYEVLFEMLRQVIDQHPRIQTVHIGMDEVYYINEHPDCSVSFPEMTNDQIFFTHLTRIVQFIKSNWPRLKILVWHDMITEYTMPEKFEWLVNEVIPVVWCYAEDVESYLSTDAIQAVRKFAEVWISPAYKGADGPTTFMSPISHYFKNHLSFFNMMTAPNTLLPVDNITTMLSAGFSRYDHLQMMSELLPSAIPALTYTLLLWNYGYVDDTLNQTTSESTLKCNRPVPWFTTEFDGRCLFPGHQVYEATAQMERLCQRGRDLRDNGNSLHPYYELMGVVHRRNAIGDMHRVKVLFEEAKRFVPGFYDAMSRVYTDDVATEMLVTYLMPVLRELRIRAAKVKKSLKSQNSWPVRPFPPLRSLRPVSLIKELSLVDSDT